MALETINPTNGVRVHAYTEASPAEVHSALANAHAAFEDWRRTPFEKRATHLPFTRLFSCASGRPTSPA